MAAQLQRVDAEGRMATTEFAFRILIIPDGYADAASRLQAARDAWARVLGEYPFTLCKQQGQAASRAFAVYAWTEGLPALNLSVTGNRISIPLDRANAISEALANTTVPDADPHGGQPATDVWPKGGRFGRRGALLVILSKRTSSAELYELTNSENYPSPIVGVVPVGVQWHQVIVRGIAQAYAGLVDEFERPEPEFLKADAQNLTLQPPNVIFVSQQRRDEFASGNNTALKGISRWPLPVQGLAIPFFAHQGDAANTTKARARNAIALIEGGGGFRFNAFRSDTDCLLRRTPYSTTLPIQDSTQFCKVCAHFLVTMLRGVLEFNATSATVEIDRQRLFFDRLDWKSVDPPLVSKPSRPVVLSAKNVGLDAVKPGWRFDVSVDSAVGMKVENLKLKDRDVAFDPFSKSEDVVKSITFSNLSVSYTLNGIAKTQPLTFADAFKEPTGVVLRVKRDGSDLAQAGVKASFTWTIPGVMVIEAESSLVVRGAKADVDPGGAVLACKYWPQLSLRYRRVARAGKKLRVDALSGTINVEMNNAIPENLELPPTPEPPDHVKHLRTGRLVTGLFTDSNASDDDSVYKDGVFGMEWQSGRKLAAVTTTIGATARRAHIHEHAPGLPHWSWLFDYVSPTIATARTVVGAYHRPYPDLNDVTKDGKANGGGPRRKVFKWPLDANQTQTPLRNHQLRVDRTARQGQYDNIHAAADHGPLHDGDTDKNATMTSAPFCGDKCNHLHWRWGSVGVSVATEPYAFLGWGIGKVGQGAHRVMGAPLIPPNQHLELTVAPGAADRCTIGYAVRAVRPGEKEWQVYLEQGIGFAFSYAGRIKSGDFRRLGGAFGQFTGIPSDTPSQQQDYELRALFDNIYHQVKFFDPDDDETKHLVLQTPSVIGPDGFLTVPSEVEDF